MSRFGSLGTPAKERALELFQYDPDAGNLIRKKTVAYNAKKGDIAVCVRKSAEIEFGFHQNHGRV